MKSKVKLSVFSLLLTIITTGALMAGCVVTYGEKPAFYILLILLLVIAIPGMMCCPTKIHVDEEMITVYSILKSRRLLMRDVESAELFQPTKSDIRLWASGGYMGYWGLFYNNGIGRYMGFYGKASDCFLVRMRNGKNYVLGCENPEAMVSYINSNRQA